MAKPPGADAASAHHLLAFLVRGDKQGRVLPLDTCAVDAPPTLHAVVSSWSGRLTPLLSGDLALPPALTAPPAIGKQPDMPSSLLSAKWSLVGAPGMACWLSQDLPT